MIVPMKKVSLVVIDSTRVQSLEKLRELGVIHLEDTAAESDELIALTERKSRFQQALRVLSSETPDDGSIPQTDAGEIAGRANELADTQQSLAEETARLRKGVDSLVQWGDFEPADITELRAGGVDVRLYHLNREQLSEIPEGTTFFTISETKATVNIAAVSTTGELELPFDEFALPKRGLSGLKAFITEKESEAKEICSELSLLASAGPLIEKGIAELDHRIEFESARAGMGLDGKLAFITGFIPARTADAMKRAASENDWAVMLDEPGEEDTIPTLIENPKWIRMIDPVFTVMDIVPGYKEMDISMWFLLFFSLFFAMLVGDAGYGLIFLIMTVAGKIIFRKAPADPFNLMFVLSIATVIWGAITGNWFGSEALAQVPVLKALIVPSLYAFSTESEFSVKYICFILAAVQLSLAHIIVALRNLNSAKALTHFGWALVVWGMFFIVKFLMLKIPYPVFSLYVIGAGLSLVVLAVLVTALSKHMFSSGEELGKTVEKLFMGVIDTFMTTIDIFKDSLSYIRLFAVGMATIAVAQSFNTLGASVGFSKAYLVPISVLIIGGGHLLNIVLALMAVAVHGLRLNLLEFSGHAGMEWSGQKYRPFSNTEES